MGKKKVTTKNAKDTASKVLKKKSTIVEAKPSLKEEVLALVKKRVHSKKRVKFLRN